MQNVENYIRDNNLINKGDIIGVACSGGRDSMSLLHYLNSKKTEFGIKLIAINIDHNLRDNSAKDSAFVVNYCEKHKIKVFMYKVNVSLLASDNNMTTEQAGREARYKIFKNLVAKGICNKIALGHHLQDQAETILINIFRGTGLNGASGMEPIRDGIYIRPLLNTSRTQIMAYITQNDIPYVDDYTNEDSDYSRNYIRNMIMPIIRNKWANADRNIAKFGEICNEDNKFIESCLDDNAIIVEDGLAKINMIYFTKPQAIVNRLILKATKQIGIFSDIETKHLKLIRNMAMEAENGTKITLPNNLSVIKEYNYITLLNKKYSIQSKTWELTKGKIDIPAFGLIDVKVTKKFELNKYSHIIDKNKIPVDAIWRYRQDGDTFTKFGGGTKSLSDYLIDKKIPNRIRKITPVLASGNEILVIAGIEISNKVKIDNSTTSAYAINVVRL